MAVKIYSGSRTVQGAQYPIFTLAYYADVSLLTVVEDYVKRHSLVPKTIQEVVSEMLEDRRAAGCSQVHLRDLKMRLNRFAGTFQGPASPWRREYFQAG